MKRDRLYLAVVFCYLILMGLIIYQVKISFEKEQMGKVIAWILTFLLFRRPFKCQCK